MTEEEIDDEIHAIVDELKDFYELKEAIRWVFKAQPLLGDRTAYDLIREGRASEVRAMLERLKSGAYL